LAVALHVVPQGKINEVELKAQWEVDGERQKNEKQKVSDSVIVSQTFKHQNNITSDEV
jgi:hypothetical protein